MQTAIPLFRINGACGISNMWFRSITGTFANGIPRFERIEVNGHGKKVYITEEERNKCRKVSDAFAELYEIEDEDMLVVDVGRYGFIKLQCYIPSY